MEKKYTLVESTLYSGAYDFKDEARVLSHDEFEYLVSCLHQHRKTTHQPVSRQPETIHFEGVTNQDV